MKITLSIPNDVLLNFKEHVGERNVSKSITELMREKLKIAQRRVAFKLIDEIADEVEKKGIGLSTEKIIRAYKDDRK